MTNNDYDRLRNVVAAGHTGDAGLAREGLADEDASVRAAALGAMSRLGALSDADLDAALGDSDAGVRRRATVVAAGRPAAIPPLLDALADDDPMVVESAAFALGEMDMAEIPDAGEAAVPESAVVASLGKTCRVHPDSLCRESAAAALGSLGHPDGLAAVLSACGDKATVRRRAVLALAAFEGPEVTDMLEHLTEDRDLQVRQAAEDLLAIERGSDT